MRTWIWIIAGLFATLTVVGTLAVLHRASDWMHGRIVRSLTAGLDSEVTLEHVGVRLLPSPWVIGRGLVVRHRGRRDVPPLIVVREFESQMSWSELWTKTVDQIRLEGLEITIPPGRLADVPDLSPDDRSAPRSAVVLRRLLAHNARLTILPKNPRRNPRVFDVFDLAMDDVAFGRASAFTATLTNPIPFGTIETTGTFGPWDADEPRHTVLAGTFQFAADLATIRGIAGSLTSEGRFIGTIENVETTGTTDTPDFRIPKLGAAPLPLRTSFDAVVDGTNGDVELRQVDVRLGQSQLRATGHVVGTQGVKGKRVRLQLTANRARVSDLLALTVKTRPPLMTGAVRLDASFDLPQGDADVLDKLRLAGHVGVTGVRFTRDRIQDKVDELSRRGQGHPRDDTINDVASDIQTRFELERGLLSVSGLSYKVTGATILLDGTYSLETGALDLSGQARLQASASATQTGIKRFALFPFNALFRKDGAGTLLALSVSGTADDPKIGLSLGRRRKGP